jgi:hypothetical protein
MSPHPLTPQDATRRIFASLPSRGEFVAVS